MGFEWIRIALTKLGGIEPHEVTQVLTAGSRWPRPAVGSGGAQILTIWGRTCAGRPLMVALRRKNEWDWWIAGARDLDQGEVAQLEGWEARGE